MSYDLAFLAPALKEWRKLDSQVRDQFKRKLVERLAEPRIVSARLSGQADRYKIKLRQAGYRLLYEVRDQELIVLVVAVGRRDRNAVYRAAERRDGDGAAHAGPDRSLASGEPNRSRDTPKE